MSPIFFHRTPTWLQTVYPKFSWKKSVTEKYLYLTFDDGPIPEATPSILDLLRHYNAKATFFCVGENIAKHPEIFKQVLQEGHAVGNHTYHHLNGWRTKDSVYLSDVAKCQHLINMYHNSDRKPLMRPPYGRIRRPQWKQLVSQYEIIMWDVLSGDYSSKISADRCLHKTIQHSSRGSIVLFHDNIKTIEKLDSVLPPFLNHFKELGYSFQPL